MVDECLQFMKNKIWNMSVVAPVAMKLWWFSSCLIKRWSCQEENLNPNMKLWYGYNMKITIIISRSWESDLGYTFIIRQLWFLTKKITTFRSGAYNEWNSSLSLIPINTTSTVAIMHHEGSGSFLEWSYLQVLLQLQLRSVSINKSVHTCIVRMITTLSMTVDCYLLFPDFDYDLKQ